MNRLPCRGTTLTELIGAIACLAILGALVVAAAGSDRLRHRIEQRSAWLEEAQNLLARWRAGGTAVCEGWTAETSAIADGELLVLHGHGIRLATARPRTGRTP